MMFDLQLSVQIYKMFLFICSRHMRYRFTNHNSEWSVNFKIDIFFLFNLIEVVQTNYWNRKKFAYHLCVRWNKELSIILFTCKMKYKFSSPTKIWSHQFDMVYIRCILKLEFVDDVKVKENMEYNAIIYWLIKININK